MRVRWSRPGAGVLASAAMLFVLGSAAVEAVPNTDFGSGDAASRGEGHLPTAVNAPGTWSSDEVVRWPVAAVGIATRTEAVGLFGKKESDALFAVSAVDGRASWIRTPGFELENWGFLGGIAVSPDGQWVGWIRPQPSSGPLARRVNGWSVLSTATGQIRQLEVPDFRWVRATSADLSFSGDSRYLLTTHERPDQPNAPRSSAHQFVAWDVEDGSPTVIEESGRYWLPSLGSAPTGVTWARGREVLRVQPGADDRAVVTLPHPVVTASWGPDDASFAYISPSKGSEAPWRLYAGRTIAEARRHRVALPAGTNPDQLLGWRDATHVVIDHLENSVAVVDVVAGEVEIIDLTGRGEHLTAPQLAGALWQQPLVPPLEPDGTTDPRRPWRWSGGALLVLFAGVLLVRRRRPPGRGSPRI